MPRFLQALLGILVGAPITLALAVAQEKNVPPPPRPASPVVIRLRSEVRLAEAIITVGAVARVEGGLWPQRQQIAALDLAEQPFTAEGVLISQEQVSYRLRLAGIDPWGFRLEGASRVHVVPSVPQVTETGVVAAARRTLLRRLPWPAEDVHIRLAEPIHVPALTFSQSDKLQLEAELAPTAKLLGRVRLDVTVNVNDQKRAVIPVALDVQLYQEVVVAACRIENGEELRVTKLHFERRLVDGVNTCPTPQECRNGKRARRPILPGQVVTRSDLEQAAAASPVIIKARDTVRLVARVGPLRVTAVGEALQDGQTGQLIRVRNVDSKAVVVGRIIDQALVEVEY